MLIELQIRNFAIIDQLHLTFAGGFNVMTGETGAGKSIILDAMSVILGGRADTTLIRAGHETAYVEATFRLSPEQRAILDPKLEEEGLEPEGAEDILVLSRELRHSGRFVCRVNGRTVTLTLMRELAEGLVDIHGQGEHLSLLRPRSHLPLLDAYGGLVSQRKSLAREVRQLHALRQELRKLRETEKTRSQRQDFLEFRVKEIDAAGLEPEEDEKLVAERSRLANSEQLAVNVQEALLHLIGADDDTPNAVDSLGVAERALMTVARLDDSQHELLERLQGLVSEVHDIAGELDEYQGEIEHNPDRLGFVEERLDLINRLKRKYGDSVAEVLEARDEAAEELEKISSSEKRITELEGIEKRYLTKIGKLGEALSGRRKEVSERLAEAVERELRDLGMPGARFGVDFHREPVENGVPTDNGRVAFDNSGIDRAEFVISTNPGEPLKPMAKVASGGETARLMLALKTALARVDATPTLIFDEIDQGIGGRIGAVVGEKLWSLTSHGEHQVIVVTHLPQLAGFGDRHFHVSKGVNEGRTITSVNHLEEGGRIEELAAMLGTQETHAREGAQSILTTAAETKKHAMTEQAS